jgi:hypothetical protein
MLIYFIFDEFQKFKSLIDGDDIFELRNAKPTKHGNCILLPLPPQTITTQHEASTCS